MTKGKKVCIVQFNQNYIPHLPIVIDTTDPMAAYFEACNYIDFESMTSGEVELTHSTLDYVYTIEGEITKKLPGATLITERVALAWINITNLRQTDF